MGSYIPLVCLSNVHFLKPGSKAMNPYCLSLLSDADAAASPPLNQPEEPKSLTGEPEPTPSTAKVNSIFESLNQPDFMTRYRQYREKNRSRREANRSSANSSSSMLEGNGGGGGNGGEAAESNSQLALGHEKGSFPEVEEVEMVEGEEVKEEEEEEEKGEGLGSTLPTLKL